MSIEKDYNKILKTVIAYRQKLAAISDGQWQLTPSLGEWSYSEVYFHIFDASLLTLDTLAETARGNGKAAETPLSSRLILFAGMLPGRKFKAPKTLAERLKKISKEDSKLLMDQFIAKLQHMLPEIKSAGSSLKTRHPRMGYFNAKQWLRFAYIHLSHHLKQLTRIEKRFKFTSLQE